MKMSHIATSRAPLSAVKDWATAPALRAPQPIMPTLMRSLPEACALREMSSAPSVAAAAAVVDAFTGDRGEFPRFEKSRI